MKKSTDLGSILEPDNETTLASELGVSESIGLLLKNRGIRTFEQAKSFFRPELSELHDPFLMLNMKEAVERIAKAKKNEENILIFGDYDVDGTCSVAQMTLALKSWGFNVHYYVPDRYTEGYGLSIQGINFAKKEHCSLLIALDCGTKAINEIQYAVDQHIDVIVCDHHEPGAVLPKAILLNHKQNNCPYPYKELTGCGIGFKFLQAISSYLNLPAEVYWELLDLNALSIGADIVPVTGENRILAFYGLKRLNEMHIRPGILAMLNLAKKTKPLTLSDIVFTLAPRINAAGRMASGLVAVELLMEKNPKKVADIASEIEEYNAERRNLDSDITQEILIELEQDADFQMRKSTVVYGENWKKGVIGIVASRLIERYYRPTVVLTQSDEIHATGSVRSVRNFDVHKALEHCSSYLAQFGGHKFAAGLTLRIDKIEEFKRAFEDYVSQNIQEESLIEPIDIELELSPESIFEGQEKTYPLPKFFRILKQFEPHGPGNMRPNFLAKGCFLNPDQTRIVGEKHLKTAFYVPNQEFGIPCIAFNMADKIDLARSGEALDVVFVLSENNFQGISSLQAEIRKLEPAGISFEDY